MLRNAMIRLFNSPLKIVGFLMLLVGITAIMISG
jgi:hypothetical protein